MSSILDRMLKASSVGATVLSESAIFKKKDFIHTDLPILNIAFSGDIDGGMVSGLTIMAGESKTFKSATSLYCMKAYFDKYPDAIAVFYDTEFGITEDYIRSFGLDPARIIHIPVEHIEQLKFDFVKKLTEIKKGEHVFFLVDSIGQIASVKEVNDALDEKAVADMSRAKALRSLLRMITIQLATKDLPCIMVNHVYTTMELYSKVVIPGGTSVTYSANNIFVISKSQEKEGTDLVGWNFTLNVHKSRFVREKAKLPFLVTYEGGIQKYSGLLDIALAGGFVIKPSNGWYQLVDIETGELIGGKVRAKDTQTDEFLGTLLTNQKFKEYVASKYKLAVGNQSDDDTSESLDDVDA